jgi:hypothetical protein
MNYHHEQKIYHHESFKYKFFLIFQVDFLFDFRLTVHP